MADVVWFTGHQFFDSDGNPLNGGLIRIYDATTTNERTVYKDDGAATPWTQPITLNSAGRLTAAIYVPEGDWKFTRTNSAGGDSITEDNIPGAVAAASAAFAATLRPILTKAANYTLTTSDLGKLVEADGTGGAFTLTLPSAVDVATGKGYDIQQIGSSGAVTVATVSAQTINGSSTFVLRPQYGTVAIVSDGANWYALPSETQYALPSAKTSAYTVKQADGNKLIPCDATSAGFTVTLPTVALAGTGFTIGFKKTDSSTNVVTVDGDGAETIDGATTATLNSQYETIWLICTGSAWLVHSSYAADLLTQAELPARNAIINGAFMVAQRGTSFTSATTPANSDDTYLLDRWILLSDGNDIVDVTQSTDAPTNGLNSIALDVETVDKKFGILQVIEQKNCIGLIGETARLTFKAKVSGSGKLDNVKAAIIAWSSTADTVTSDIVSAWNVEATNPTLVANWTYENTPANLSVTTSWAQYTLTALIDTASTTNIGVFIWSDVDDTDLGDFLRITDVQLEKNAGTATAFQRRLLDAELSSCCRYFQLLPEWLGAWVAATTTFSCAGPFPVTMIAAPTATFVSGTAGVTEINVASRNVSAVASSSLSVRGGNLALTTAAATLNNLGNTNSGLVVHLSAEL